MGDLASLTTTFAPRQEPLVHPARRADEQRGMPAPKPTRRSHVVPRFLIRRFAFAAGPERGRVNALTQGNVVGPALPETVGVDNHFYSQAGVFLSAEQVLASEESALAKSVAHWQPGQLAGDDAKAACSLVLHLLLRGHAARASFNRLLATPVEDARRGFAEEARASLPDQALEHDLSRRVLDRLQPNGVTSEPALAGALRAALAEALPAHLAAWHGQSLLRLAQLLREDPTWSCLVPIMHTHVVCMMIVNRLTHDSALNHLHWSVHASHDEPLLVGDCGPLVRSRPGSRLCGMTLDNLAPLLVVLPIATDRLLVGAAAPDARLPTARTINRATAEVSRMFVAGAWSKGALRMLAHRSGLRAHEALAIAKTPALQAVMIGREVARLTRNFAAWQVEHGLGVRSPISPPQP